MDNWDIRLRTEYDSAEKKAVLNSVNLSFWLNILFSLLHTHTNKNYVDIHTNNFVFYTKKKERRRFMLDHDQNLIDHHHQWLWTMMMMKFQRNYWKNEKKICSVIIMPEKLVNFLLQHWIIVNQWIGWKMNWKDDDQVSTSFIIW